MLIPSPNVTANHQYHNAIALEKKGAAFVIEEKKLKNDFEEVFKNLVTNIGIQQGMTKELKALAKPEAAKSIVKELTTLI